MKTIKLFVLPVVLLTILAGSCSGARILALLPLPMRSHWVVMEPLLQELAVRGHQLTVFSTFPQKTPLANYTDVDFSHILPSLLSAFTIDKIKNEIWPPWGTPIFFNKTHGQICKLMREPEFQEVLRSKDKYDLVITEVFGNDCLAYYAYKLQLPLVSFTTSMLMPWSADRVGLPDNPSYIPNYLVSFSPEMTLWERTFNTVVLLYAKFWQLCVFGMGTRSLTEEAFGESLPRIDEVVANTSVLFINSYHVLDQSRPFPPNVIEVGGIHIRERRPLPENIKEVLDGAKNGVILMSFGSLVRASTIPKSTIRMFLNVFAKIPQTVILKYEEDLPEAPPNVIPMKWIPQRDMIEHEKVIAVILHGGQASTIEATYFGKPMIGVPFFADQFNNIKKVVRRNGGIQLDLDNLSEDKIATAVKEITTNPKYKEGMRRLSEQYRDRPMTALQSAVYWTEYVIRHQGAPHLRPASVSLPLYQYLLLDVIALLATALFATLTVIFWIIMFFTNKLKRGVLRKTSSQKKTD